MTILKSITVTLLVLFLLLFLYRPVEIGEIGFHLKVGEWMLAHGGVPQAYPFAGDVSAPWQHYEWLSSLSFYSAYLSGGINGLKILRAVFFIGLVAFLFFQGFRRVPLSILILLITVVAYGLQTRAFLTSSIFNFLFITIFLLLLFKYDQTLDHRWLWGLPLSGVFWVNMHIGSFFYGFSILGIFIMSSLLQYLDLKSSRRYRKKSSDYLQQIKDIIFITLVYLCVFFCTPYGIYGFIYPFKVFFTPEFVHTPVLRDFVMPFHSPELIFFGDWSLWFMILVFFVLFSFIGNKNNRFTLMLLFVFALALLLKNSRGSGLFALVCGIMTVQSAKAMSLKRAWGYIKQARLWDAVLLICLILFFCAQIIRLGNNRVIIKDEMKPLAALEYIPHNPNSAINFLNSFSVKTTVFSPKRWSGQILWEGYPQVKPFIDDRKMNREHDEAYRNMLNEPAVFFKMLSRKYGINAVLLSAADPNQHKLSDYLVRQTDWPLVLVDGYSVVFLKKDTAELSKDVIQLQPKLKALEIESGDIQELQSIVNMPFEKAWKNALRPQLRYVDIRSEAITLYGLGYKGAGVKMLLEAAQISDQKMTRDFISFVLRDLNLRIQDSGYRIQ